MNEAALNKDDIRTALQDVIDPEVGVGVMELGLIYGFSIGDQGHARVEMTMTTPACPMGSYLTDQVREALLRNLPQLTSVEVEVVWEPPWTPEMMSDAAKRQLGWSES